jgi:hypothetical protein
MNDRIQELEAELEDLYQGRRIVTPRDSDHAYNMLMIAGAYIHHAKHDMWNTLKELAHE